MGRSEELKVRTIVVTTRAALRRRPGRARLIRAEGLRLLSDLGPMDANLRAWAQREIRTATAGDL